MEPTAWTDARLDDLAASIDNTFELLRGDIRDLRTEMVGEFGAVRTEMRDEFAAVRTEMRDEFAAARSEVTDLRTDMRNEFRAFRADFAASQRQLAQIGWALSIGVLGALVALIVTAG